MPDRKKYGHRRRHHLLLASVHLADGQLVRIRRHHLDAVVEQLLGTAVGLVAHADGHALCAGQVIGLPRRAQLARRDGLDRERPTQRAEALLDDVQDLGFARIRTTGHDIEMLEAVAPSEEGRAEREEEVQQARVGEDLREHPLHVLHERVVRVVVVEGVRGPLHHHVGRLSVAELQRLEIQDPVRERQDVLVRHVEAPVEFLVVKLGGEHLHDALQVAEVPELAV